MKLNAFARTILLMSAPLSLVSAPLWGQTPRALTQPASLCSGTEAVNAKTCAGAHGDLHIATCSVSARSTKLLCSEPQFTGDAAGMAVYVAGAGDADSSTSLQATIRAYVSPLEATLSKPALSSHAHAHTLWGSDDTAALQAAYAMAVSKGKALYLPAGSYLHHGLNWTGNNLKIYGDSYGGTFLFALAVTNPGKTTQGAQATGVDISASGYNEVDHIAFFGGWFGMADLAPQVNVLGGRAGLTGNDLAIAHIFDGDFFTTFGPYDVVLFGYEQTSFLNPHFESDAGQRQPRNAVSLCCEYARNQVALSNAYGAEFDDGAQRDWRPVRIRRGWAAGGAGSGAWGRYLQHLDPGYVYPSFLRSLSFRRGYGLHPRCGARQGQYRDGQLPELPGD